MRSGLDVKIFLWLQAAGVEQDFAAPLAGAFHHHLCNPFRIDFYVRQRVGNMGTDDPFSSFRKGGKRVVCPHISPIVSVPGPSFRLSSLTFPY